MLLDARATGGAGCRADDGDARFRSAGVGVGRARTARNGLRQSLHGRGARVGLGSGAGLLPIGHELAPLSVGRGRAPRDGARDHRRVQRGVSRAGGYGLLSVVAAAVDVAARERGDALPLRAARQGPRLQLAQRDRLLVRADPRRADGERDGHLLHLGEQSGLHADRQPETCRSRRTRRRARWRTWRSGRARRRTRRRPDRGEAERRGAGRAEQAVRERAPRAFRCRRRPSRDARIARGARRTSGAHVAHDDHPASAAPGRSGGLLDVRPRVLEQLRALDADPRRTHGRRRPMGAVRGDEPRAESPRVAALRPHG